MRQATRPMMERILIFDDHVRAGRYPNTASVGAELECSPRTIQRDIEFFRDRWRAPLGFDRRRNGYHYTDPDWSLSHVLMTEGELFALFLAERILRQYRNTPFGADLARAFERLAANLTDTVQLDLSYLDGSFSFHGSDNVPFTPELFGSLVRAVRQRERLQIEYWTASRDATSVRDVDPYHLACNDGVWYLIAYCHTRRDILMFVPGRIRALTPTSARFERPQGFDIAGYMANSFGVLRSSDGSTYTVRLRFTGMAARFVRERTWHHSQQIEETGGDAIIATFQLGHLRDVETWALSWGAECEVLEPVELRGRIRLTCQKMANTHT